MPEEEKEPIVWSPKEVNPKDLIANPNNPKIETEFGRQRLQDRQSNAGRFKKVHFH